MFEGNCTIILEVSQLKLMYTDLNVEIYGAENQNTVANGCRKYAKKTLASCFRKTVSTHYDLKRLKDKAE